MMSILNAYKPLIPIPTISRLFSISHARSSTTKTSAGYRERSEENFNLRFKKYTDLEYRKLVCKRNKVTTERYQRRPEIRARNREYATVARIVKGPSLGPRGAPWSIWLREHAWVRDELDWMSHKPVWSDVKVERNCELCNYPPANGAKLWWQRKHDPTLFDCTPCFAGDEPLKALPGGCEGVKTLAELRARKQALEQGLKPGSLSQTETPKDSKS